MPRQPLRLVALFTLAVFLIANGPVNVVSLAALADRPIPRSTDTPKRCCHDCCCHENVPDENTTKAAEESPAPSHHCPCCPDCPTNCCWCCAAKVPCCPPAQGVVPVIITGLGDRLAEAVILFPVPPPVELLQPPRA
jgi:hypothetical protein